MKHPPPLPTDLSLRRLVGLWAVLAVPMTACDPDKAGGKKGTIDSGPEVELPPFPEEVLGVPNLDDDNEDGEHDWNGATGTDDEQVPVEIDPTVWDDLEADTTITVSFEG